MRKFANSEIQKFGNSNLSCPLLPGAHQSQNECSIIVDLVPKRSFLYPWSSVLVVGCSEFLTSLSHTEEMLEILDQTVSRMRISSNIGPKKCIHSIHKCNKLEALLSLVSSFLMDLHASFVVTKKNITIITKLVDIQIVSVPCRLA